jgi:hypothetical protein
VKWSIKLKKFPELFQAQPGVANNATHRERVDRIMARDDENSRSIGHDNVGTLTKNPEARLFQRGYGPKVIDSR